MDVLADAIVESRYVKSSRWSAGFVDTKKL